MDEAADGQQQQTEQKTVHRKILAVGLALKLYIKKTKNHKMLNFMA
jgi:hypothetical protein